MQAVFLHPPSHDIRVETVPIPEISEPDDVIVKVSLAGLCGSDLHPYRGNGHFQNPFIMGHEFVGEVVKLGSSYGSSASASRPKLYSTLGVGDKVVSPFSTSCSECRFCQLGFTSRCVHSKLIGSQVLPGAQAQYLRIPHGGGTLFLAPSHTIADSSLLLLADILPTGYFAALQALEHQNLRPYLNTEKAFLGGERGGSAASEPLLFAVVVLGPVGLCALVSLLDILAERNIKGSRILAIDLNEDRRTKARKMIAKTGVGEQLVSIVSPDDAKEIVKDGPHAHAVLEVVGNNSALLLAYDLIRPFGVIASVGVHTHPQFPLGGESLYDKNVGLIFGRCPVRNIFPQALALLVRRQDVFGLVGDEAGLVDQIVGMSDAEVKQAYLDFDSGKVGKTLFDPWR